jgi:hypothetical protein
MRLQNTCNINSVTVTVKATVKGERIAKIEIDGDLGADPSDFITLLDKHLIGVGFRRESVTNAVNTFYLLGAKTEKITKEQLIEAIMGLRKA